jgi:hypothetical protein
MRKVFLMVFALGALPDAHPAVPAELEIIPLPPLQIGGQPATAHTQGMEIVEGQFFVTARLETARPKQAILARTVPQSTGWDTWDITPATPVGASGPFDHPGGFQSDGQRLWIPVSESVRKGRTVIRVFELNRLKPSKAATPDFEFAVPDHIGALAVGTNQSVLLGASWDTETVYVWDLKGHLQRTLAGVELKNRNLGIISGPDGHAGVAVQDWKMAGECLYASGLFGDPSGRAPRPRSRLLVFTRFLQPNFECQQISLPNAPSVELAQEAMTLSHDFLFCFPENLGPSNRCFRFRLPDQPLM